MILKMNLYLFILAASFEIAQSLKHFNTHLHAAMIQNQIGRNLQSGQRIDLAASVHVRGDLIVLQVHLNYKTVRYLRQHGQQFVKHISVDDLIIAEVYVNYFAG